MGTAAGRECVQPMGPTTGTTIVCLLYQDVCVCVCAQSQRGHKDCPVIFCILLNLTIFLPEITFDNYLIHNKSYLKINQEKCVLYNFFYFEKQNYPLYIFRLLVEKFGNPTFVQNLIKIASNHDKTSRYNQFCG